MSVLEKYDAELDPLLNSVLVAMEMSIPEHIRRECVPHSQIGLLTALVRIAAYSSDLEDFKDSLRWQIQCIEERTRRNAQ